MPYYFLSLENFEFIIKALSMCFYWNSGYHLRDWSIHFMRV